MPRIRLVHWGKQGAPDKVRRLRAAGHVVDHGELDPTGRRRLRQAPPSVVVIDLERLPSQGRDLALWLRSTKATRHVPLVFVGGEPGKVTRIRKQLPDAVYTTWRGISGAVRRAIERPPQDPVVPSSALAGYSGTPLLRKLGVKSAAVVALVGAPEDFERTLGALPDGVRLRRRAGRGADLTLWFVRSRRELDRRIARMSETVGAHGLWIAWPKQASGRATDLTQNDVRRRGLSHGLVDFKICSIDSTWSGLKFTLRKG